ncbi:MAG: ANTAR domain-containing protein [Propionicimonas sp.]|jgi:hypothetical protein
MPSSSTHYEGDASWLTAVLSAIQDCAVVFDSAGRVLGVNQAFSDLLGYGVEVTPSALPYPWWPTPEEDAEALAVVVDLWQQALRGEPVSGECRLCRVDRRPVWVHMAVARLDRSGPGPAGLATFRRFERERSARERRVAAADASAEFSVADDLETVLAVAEHVFSLLFDGGTTVQLNVSEEPFFVTGGARVSAEQLPPGVLQGLAGQASADAVALRPGILLAPPSAEADCRAWIQFSAPRRIGPDEMIVADLLAKAFALAVDRVLAAEQAADRVGNLSRAVESRQLIGQAVGILIERHRLTPNDAFGRLKTSSHNRNLKLRELASRMIESGLDPEEA